MSAATLEDTRIQLEQAVRDRELAEPARRQVTFDVIEIREEGDKIRFEGHAAVFDRLSEDLGGFRERIQRGAFRKALDKNPDVRFLFNHNPDNVLARTASGTMELREDPKGLLVTAEIAPTQLGRDLRLLVQRGDVSQMSFSFRVRPDGEDVWDDEGGELVRTIISFDSIYDVGPVTFPAYPQTDASMRSYVCGTRIVGADGEPLEDIVRELAWKIHRGEVNAAAEERSAIDAVLSKLDTVSPWVAQRALRAVSQEPELQGVIQGKRATVVMDDVPVGEAPFRLAARRRRRDLRQRLLR